MLTEAELAEIDAREKAASPRSWKARPIWLTQAHPDEFDVDGPAETGLDGGISERDATFIAHARDDVGRLLEDVRRLRELLRPFADIIAGPGEHVSGYHSTETLLESDPDVREEFYTSLGPFQAAYRAIYPKGS